MAETGHAAGAFRVTENGSVAAAIQILHCNGKEAFFEIRLPVTRTRTYHEKFTKIAALGWRRSTL
jgi:hypothetical protein